MCLSLNFSSVSMLGVCVCLGTCRGVRYYKFWYQLDHQVNTGPVLRIPVLIHLIYKGSLYTGECSLMMNVMDYHQFAK